MNQLSFNRDKDLFDVIDILSESLVSGHKVAYCCAGMKNCSVILASDLRTDGRERAVDEAARHVHRNLSCLNDLSLSCLRQEFVAGDVEIITDNSLYLIYRNLVLLFADNLLSDLLSKFNCNLLMCKSSVCNKSYCNPFYWNVGNMVDYRTYMDCNSCFCIASL